MYAPTASVTHHSGPSQSDSTLHGVAGGGMPLVHHTAATPAAEPPVLSSKKSDSPYYPLYAIKGTVRACVVW